MMMAAIWLFSVPAFAHVRWFVAASPEGRPYALTDIPVLIWIMVACVVVLLGVFLERKLTVPRWFSTRVRRWGPSALSAASIGVGAALILFSLGGFIFSPDLHVHDSSGMALLILQAVAGALLLFGLYERVGALIVFTLCVFLAARFGITEVFNKLELIGFAVYALLVGRPRWRVAEVPWFAKAAKRYASYAVPFLRIGVGLNLIILAFMEKILAPGFVLNFLQTHPWNFMQIIGFHGFVDYWFGFSAAMVELLFGIFFVFGLITRVTTIALAFFLLLTLFLLGPMELVGHLPHFSIAVVLLVYGSGERWVLMNRATARE